MKRRWIELGRRWVEMYLYSLQHHGTKGQKWGVRNGPPYPLDRQEGRDISVAKEKNSGIIEEAIKLGKVKTNINREKQLRHTKSHHIEGRSYLDGDLDFAQKLIDELSGTGEALIDKKGEWTHRERVSSEKVIGTYVDSKSKSEAKTKAAMIVYSRTGAHIYPRKEDDY